MTRKTNPSTNPTNPEDKAPEAKPVRSKLDELRARYAQSARGKAAAEASSSTKPKKVAAKKKGAPKKPS